MCDVNETCIFRSFSYLISVSNLVKTAVSMHKTEFPMGILVFCFVRIIKLRSQIGIPVDSGKPDSTPDNSTETLINPNPMR